MDLGPASMVPLPETERLTASRWAGASAGAVANQPRGYRAILGRIELVQPLIPKHRVVGRNHHSPWRNAAKCGYFFVVVYLKPCRRSVAANSASGIVGSPGLHIKLKLFSASTFTLSSSVFGFESRISSDFYRAGGSR